MSIIEDALKRAGAEEVKVEDLRPGDKFVLWEPYECGLYEGIFDRSEEGVVYQREPTSSLIFICDDQRWYLVERAPVDEPTGWGAVVEVDGKKYSRVPYEGSPDTAPWVSKAGSWSTWDDLAGAGPKVLFEGISE